MNPFDLEWKPLSFRHNGNTIETADSEEGYYARVRYPDGTIMTYGPVTRKLNAVNAVKRDIDQTVAYIYPPMSEKDKNK